MYTNSVTKFLWADSSHSMLVRLRKQTLPFIMCILLQGVAYGGFVSTSESYDGNFAFTFKESELFFLRNGLYGQPTYNDHVYLMPLFSFQVCYHQGSSSGTATVNPDIADLENSSNIVKTVIRVIGNGESSSGYQDIMFLPSADTGKTVKILNDSECFSNNQLNTSSHFTVTGYDGTKIANDQEGLLKHYTNTSTSVSNPASPSTATASSTDNFVYDKTTFSGCRDDNDNSGLITIQGYAYIQDLIENPGLTYTMPSNLTIEITDT
ncbi:MAG: hypothetical protein VX737_04110 [Pseudomonadota bacterium]|nr:hypothetical protein [Pseudomonadota bacterium]